jgi:hypothetical protein
MNQSQDNQTANKSKDVEPTLQKLNLAILNMSRPQKYTSRTPRCIAPSQSPAPSCISNYEQFKSPLRPNFAPGLQNTSHLSHQQVTDPVYSDFCRQILRIFQNLALGLRDARPGVEAFPNDQDNYDLIPIRRTSEHRRIAHQACAAVIAFSTGLQLPPQPPYSQEYSQEDIELNLQTLWIIAYPHHFSPHGEMRSGMCDYFRKAEKELKVLSERENWGFIARRCRREFAVFLERLPGCGYETMFDYTQGEW